MKAYVFITVAPGRCADVVGTVRRVAGVKSADICWGLPDIVALVEAADATTLQKLVLDKVQQISGVNQTATHIIFE
jgi:DNA-binding Lrp family transcriptional regulator